MLRTYLTPWIQSSASSESAFQRRRLAGESLCPASKVNSTADPSGEHSSHQSSSAAGWRGSGARETGCLDSRNEATSTQIPVSPCRDSRRGSLACPQSNGHSLSTAGRDVDVRDSKWLYQTPFPPFCMPYAELSPRTEL